MENAKRVILNTGVLYIRLLLVMVIGLFTTRIVLGALGEVNYGIYMLVAGVVSMLAVLQSAMTSASMRYVAHSLGSKDESLISETFNTTLILHFILGIVIVLIIEIGGIIMFKYFLNIPADKIYDAKVVYHFMALTTFVAIISVPYDALINSHENMLLLSIVDVIGAILKLGVGFLLLHTAYSQLIVYGIGVFLVQLIIRIIKQIYSRIKYKESKINLHQKFNRNLIKSILSFSGWSLLGSISAMTVNQFRSVILNMFFGVTVNASEGIAKTASSQVNNISVSLTHAINPIMLKSEGSGNRDRMLRILNISTKFSTFLFALVSIPVIIELPFLLDLWLTDVPEYAIIFGRLALIAMLVEKFSFEITNAIRAVGKIRNLTIAESTIRLMSVAFAYFLFTLGYPNHTIYVVGILSSLILFFERLYFGKHIAGLNISDFVKNSVLPVLIVIIISTFVSLSSFLFHITETMRLFSSTFIYLISYIILFRYIALRKDELGYLKLFLNKFQLRKSNISKD